MAKYKVMSSVGDGKEFMNGIEIDYILNEEGLGDEVSCLGGKFEITQKGKILVLSSQEWVLTLMLLEDNTKDEKEKLEINKNLDIFFETRKISVRCDCTYGELYDILKQEWNNAGSIMPLGFPLEYDSDLKLLTLNNDWEFEDGSLVHLREGSFSEKNIDGRSK